MQECQAFTGISGEKAEGEYSYTFHKRPDSEPLLQSVSRVSTDCVNAMNQDDDLKSQLNKAVSLV